LTIFLLETSARPERDPRAEALSQLLKGEQLKEGEEVKGFDAKKVLKTTKKLLRAYAIWARAFFFKCRLSSIRR